MNNWRLIRSPAMNAAANMAFDQKLLDDFMPGLSRPVVRLYRWSPASFSIGRSQNPNLLLRTNNFVRRPTGGGLLYHDDELTYAIVLAPRDLGTSGNVKDVFRRITGFLIRAYQKMGLGAAFAVDLPHHIPNAASLADVCLSRHEDCDIVIQGKKIGGNAQRRGRDKLLQHGSIPFSLSPAVYREALRTPGLLNLNNVTSLNETLGRRIEWYDLEEILIESIAEHFNATLTLDETHGTPTPLAQETARL
jgi:lipoate-protein ligase A